MKTIATVALAAATAIAAVQAGNLCPDGTSGGFFDAEVTKQASDLLAKTLSNTDNYPTGTKPMCLHKVTHVMQQIVAGVNYKFGIEGCVLDRPTSSGYCHEMLGCKRKEYLVNMYAAPSSDVGKITSITQTSD